MSEATPNLAALSLEQQIKTYTDFDRELSSGGSAKAVMGEIKAKSRDLWQVNPDEITVLEGYNPRTQNLAYFEGIAALRDNMIKHGYMQDKPLAGYIAKIDGVNKLVLQDGHRRLAAVRQAIEKGAPIKSVPVVLKDSSLNMVDLTVALLHSNEGQPFTTYEKAVLAKRLKKYGWDNAQIAAEMLCSRAFVGELLVLAGSSEAIQQMVKDGQISATEAIATVKAHGEAAAGVVQARVEAAKAKGKKKTTHKDTLTDEEAQKSRNAKKHGYELYQCVVTEVFNKRAVVDAMTKVGLERLDALLTAIEKVRKPREPKPPKAAKPPKAPKAVKAPKPIKVKPEGAKPRAKKAAVKPAGWPFTDTGKGKKGAKLNGTGEHAAAVTSRRDVTRARREH